MAGLHVPHMPIDVATTLGSDNANQQFDGVIGFGWKSANLLRPVQSCIFMEYITSDLAEPIFAVDFWKDGSGTIEFGRVDETAYKGQLTSFTVDNSTGTWVVDGVSFDFGDHQAQSMSIGKQHLLGFRLLRQLLLTNVMTQTPARPALSSPSPPLPPTGPPCTAPSISAETVRSGYTLAAPLCPTSIFTLMVTRLRSRTTLLRGSTAAPGRGCV